MASFSDLQGWVINGQREKVLEATHQFLEQGESAKTILDKGLLPGMAVVGKKFEAGEFFIPEMLIAARALNAGLEVLRPLLEKSAVKPIGKVVMGTVKGDIHDIGKNIVGVMLRGGGFEVIDAGVDVAPDRFMELARENDAGIVGLSALLTTTMTGMKTVIEAFEANGLRDKVKIMIGGAPITRAYADQIGADGFAPNAPAAVGLARRLVGVIEGPD